MKKIILFISLVLVTSGCTANRIDLIETKAIVLNEVVPPELKINTSVYEDDGNLVIP